MTNTTSSLTTIAATQLETATGGAGVIRTVNRYFGSFLDRFVFGNKPEPYVRNSFYVE